MLDKKDKAILGILKKDGRTTVRDIAKKTGIRPSTVHQRVQKLIRDRVIERFTIQTDDAAMGEDLHAFILIKGSTQKYLGQAVLQDTRVKEIFGVTGEYDMFIKLKFSSVKEFNDYLIEFRKKYPDVQTTMTMVGTTKIKEEL